MKAYDISYTVTLLGKVTVWAEGRQEAEIEARRRGARLMAGREDMVHYEVTASGETPPISTEG